MLGKVKSISYNKLIRYLETNIISLDSLGTPRHFIQQSSDPQRLRPVRLQQVPDVSQRQASVENIFDQDEILAFHRAVHILYQPYFAALPFGISVTGNGNEIEADVELDLPRQVSQKNSRSLEHADQQNRFAGKIGSDARAQLGYLGRDLPARNQNREFVHQ